MHESIKSILSPLRPFMSKPDVVMCPDGLYRRAVHVLGPYIADYPEQVILAGIVSGWCVRCGCFPSIGFFYLIQETPVVHHRPNTSTDPTLYCGPRNTLMPASPHLTPRKHGKITGLLIT